MKYVMLVNVGTWLVQVAASLHAKDAWCLHACWKSHWSDWDSLPSEFEHLCSGMMYTARPPFDQAALQTD